MSTKVHKSIWDAVVDGLNHGRPIYINLNKKSLFIGKTAYVKSGIGVLPFFHDELEIEGWEYVEELYSNYKKSLPSGRMTEESRYFKPGKLEDITDILAAPGMYRTKTLLEAYVLLGGLEGQLKMPNEKYYFWQSDKDKDLVVLKKWIVKE